MPNEQLIIATRESALALWQANFIAAQLREAHPGLDVTLLPMTTKGDQWLSSPLSTVGGKGLFIKELEQAMLDGRAHLAVHCIKDMPAQLPDGFCLAAIGFRDDARDALVCPAGLGLDSLPQGSRIGSSSLRRQALVRSRRPDLQVLPVRGNVGTRLGKLDAGEYDALILASTGLTRLGLEDRVTETLDTDWCIPAVGQGALGIECMSSDTTTRALVEVLHNSGVAACVNAERALSAGLGASCSTPLGGYCVPDALPDGGQQLHLRATLGTTDGRRLLHAEALGTEPEVLGQQAAQELQAQGADDILRELSDSLQPPK